MLIFRMKQRCFQTADEAQIIACVTEILQCLDRLNRANFSQRIGVRPEERQVADRVAYPISELLRMLVAAICDADDVECPQDVRRILVDAAEQLAVAWSAFMAGDIDDLLAEVTTTNQFRGRDVRWNQSGRQGA